MGSRWTVEQVEAIAPSAAASTAAAPVAVPVRWSGLGADERAVWGAFAGTGAEPYDVAVDHVAVAFRCSCPSRRVPCKHALALLLLWARGHVPDTTGPPAPVATWLGRRSVAASGRDADVPDERPTPGATVELAPGPPPEAPPPPTPDDRDRARNERIEKMMAGLAELDRWLQDRMRTGLADPALARFDTWDTLAARLVDARAAGSLANRVRRLAGRVGASPTWHADVLAELGLLHLLATAGRRIGELPGALADGVATTVGWQVRQTDVLAGVPDTDRWVVAGRSDAREDRIEVRRHWLYGTDTDRWALVLSFAAYQQSLDSSLEVGTVLHADLHRYPGPALRALVGRRHDDPVPGRPPAVDVTTACDAIGTILAAEPWLDRAAVTVRATPAPAGGGWWLTDDRGSLPLVVTESLATLLAVSAGRPVDVTVEWTPDGVVPLAIHAGGTSTTAHAESLDIGPRADPSFVGAA